MSSDDIRNFMGYLWYQVEDGVVTIGVNEEGLEELDEITSVELSPENDKVDAEEVCGGIETNDGPMDIYSPVSGKIIEINSAVIEDPDLIQEDPYGEGWLLKIEPDEDIDNEDEDDVDDLNEDEEDVDDED